MRKKQDLTGMPDEELLKSYKVGYKWVSDRMLVTDTDKNEIGKLYDHQEFLLGLKRLEAIEDELQKRGIVYG